MHQNNDRMLKAIFVLMIIVLIRVLVTLETRVLNKINKDAEIRQMKIISLREANESEKKSLSEGLDIWGGGNSTILGFSGERVYHKIAIIEESKGEYQKYLVKVKTTFFIPSDIDWKKVEA